MRGRRKSCRGRGEEHMECIHVVAVGSSLLLHLSDLLVQMIGHCHGSSERQRGEGAIGRERSEWRTIFPHEYACASSLVLVCASDVCWCSVCSSECMKVWLEQWGAKKSSGACRDRHERNSGRTSILSTQGSSEQVRRHLRTRP